MHRALNRTLGKHRALRRKGTPAASAGPSSAVVAAPHQSSSGDDDAATAARTESMNRARRKTSNGSLDRAPRRVVATVGVERAPSVAAARAEEWALQQKALSAEHLSRAAQTAGQDGADTVAADVQHAQLDAETERRLDEAEQTARRTWLRVPLERLPPRLRDEYQAKTSPWARRRASIHILSSAMGLRHRLSNAGLPLELHARFLQESGLSSQRELEQVEVGDMVEILNDMDLEVRLGLHGRADLFEIARALTVTAASRARVRRETKAVRMSLKNARVQRRWILHQQSIFAATIYTRRHLDTPRVMPSSQVQAILKVSVLCETRIVCIPPPPGLVLTTLSRERSCPFFLNCYCIA